MRKGFLIAQEGGEGSGKSVIGRELFNYLRDLGLNILFIREPGGTEISEQIRKILLEGRGNMSLKTELLLFLAARAQIVEEVVRPHLDGGGIVLMDRFRYSTDVYQGIARGLGLKRTRELNDFVTENLHPDLTLFYDVDPETGLNRKSEKNRLDLEDLEFHRKVRQGYLEIIPPFGYENSKWHIVDANKTQTEVLTETIRVVTERLTLAGFIESPNTRKEARG